MCFCNTVAILLFLSLLLQYFISSATNNNNKCMYMKKMQHTTTTASNMRMLSSMQLQDFFFIFIARKPTKSTNEKAFFWSLWKYVLYCNSLTTIKLLYLNKLQMYIKILQDNLNTSIIVSARVYYC